jgi:hypothetical protein
LPTAKGSDPGGAEAAAAKGLLKKMFGWPERLPITLAPAVAWSPSAIAKIAFEISGVK